MSVKTNQNGKGYEYACIVSLRDMINRNGEILIENNKSFALAKKYWDNLNEDQKNIYSISAKAAARQIIALEPNLSVDGWDVVKLELQNDLKGVSADVRDIVISRQKKEWEIGISVKHNHFAVKHSRLSSVLDFAYSWFGSKCSDTYWSEVRPVFETLRLAKQEGKLFNELPDKEQTIYRPVLNAFAKELKRLFESKEAYPGDLVEYLLGKYDFYKVISEDKKRYTTIQAVNVHSTLNRESDGVRSEMMIPCAKLPTRLIQLSMLPGSNTTLELYLDKGWQFTFRIHNASGKAEPSLRFDILIVGMPTAVITINSRWL